MERGTGMPEQSIEKLASMQDLAEKLPFNLEAEQSVLGAVLIDSSCLPTVMEYLKPDSFYKPSHRVIFASMVRLFYRRVAGGFCHRAGSREK